MAYSLPDSLTSFNKDSIGSCANIKSISIPNCATDISRCFTFTNLISLTLWNKLTTYMDSSLFWSSVPKLLTINFNGTKEQCVNTIIKSFKSYVANYEDKCLDFTIYCTDGQITKVEALQ